MEELKELTECSICTENFTDPRMLPCIHSFCLKCLEKIQLNSDGNKTGKMSCPVCRAEFIIPKEGIIGLKKNFFMQKLIEITKISNTVDKTKLCEVCTRDNEEQSDKLLSVATKYCIECHENMCDHCSMKHKSYKISRDHQIMSFGSELSDEVVKKIAIEYCDYHYKEEIKLYCMTCEKGICTLCFAVNHQLHKCVEIDKMADEFLEKLDNDLKAIMNYSAESISKRNTLAEEKKKLMKMVENAESAIIKRSTTLKKHIDIQMKSLLEDLSAIKAEKLKELETVEQETKDLQVSLDGLTAYCYELKCKGSSVNICQSVHEVHERVAVLKKMQRKVRKRKIPSVDVSFRFSNLEESVKNENTFGQLEVGIQSSAVKEKKVVVVGIDNNTNGNEVFELSLNKPHEISSLEPVPTEMQVGSVAVACDNKLFVIGAGKDAKEIWKFKTTSGWTKCASLVEGRRGHCANLIGHTLYICGGFLDSQKNLLKSMEAYDTVKDKCTTVGELVQGVRYFATATYNGLIYIFGGHIGGNKDTDCIQIYNNIDNTCVLSTWVMPISCRFLRTVSWKTSVIFLLSHTCFIFDFETGIFQERIQFKTDVYRFGSVLHDGKLYIFGGNRMLQCREDIRCVTLLDIINGKNVEWKQHGRLPKPSPCICNLTIY